MVSVMLKLMMELQHGRFSKTRAKQQNLHPVHVTV